MAQKAIHIQYFEKSYLGTFTKQLQKVTISLYTYDSITPTKGTIVCFCIWDLDQVCWHWLWPKLGRNNMLHVKTHSHLW